MGSTIDTSCWCSWNEIFLLCHIFLVKVVRPCPRLCPRPCPRLWLRLCSRPCPCPRPRPRPYPWPRPWPCPRPCPSLSLTLTLSPSLSLPLSLSETLALSCALWVTLERLETLDDMISEVYYNTFNFFHHRCYWGHTLLHFDHPPQWLYKALEISGNDFRRMVISSDICHWHIVVTWPQLFIPSASIDIFTRCLWYIV